MFYRRRFANFDTMNNIAEYIYIAQYIAPAFSAISCIVLLLLSYHNSLTHTELSIKQAATLYMGATAFNWMSVFLYLFFPSVFVIVQAPLYLSLMFAPVFFYRLIHILTSLRNKEHFSVWHYLIPAAISLTPGIWSLFVPYEIQQAITEGWGTVRPEGYEVYSYLFTSKMLMRFIYGVIYMTLVFVRLSRYHKAVNGSPNLIRKPLKWIRLLALLTVASMGASAISAIMRTVGLYFSLLGAVASALIIAQQIFLTYHIIQRGYMLYITFPGREHAGLGTDKAELPSTDTRIATPAHKSQHAEKPRKTYSRSSGNTLTKESFEAYFRKNKPYLNPSFRITDLVEAMDVNRSYLSGFVNKTYGMNFNRYVNRCRLLELQKLNISSASAGKPLAEVTVMAGFSNLRHYQRAAAAEEAEKAEKAEEDEKAKKTEKTEKAKKAEKAGENDKTTNTHG